MESHTSDKLQFAELPQDDEFKNNVCYPYFRDIYIVSRSLHLMR